MLRIRHAQRDYALSHFLATIDPIDQLHRSSIKLILPSIYSFNNLCPDDYPPRRLPIDHPAMHDYHAHHYAQITRSIASITTDNNSTDTLIYHQMRQIMTMVNVLVSGICVFAISTLLLSYIIHDYGIRLLVALLLAILVIGAESFLIYRLITTVSNTTTFSTTRASEKRKHD